MMRTRFDMVKHIKVKIPSKETDGGLMWDLLVFKYITSIQHQLLFSV